MTLSQVQKKDMGYVKEEKKWWRIKACSKAWFGHSSLGKKKIAHIQKRKGERESDKDKRGVHTKNPQSFHTLALSNQIA
jgi:hypothetical protein